MFRQTSPRYLVDFGQHGSLLRQPLIAPPSTDSHSVQTDDKQLATAVTSTKTEDLEANSGDHQTKTVDVETSGVGAASPGRCRLVTLVLLAVLLVVVAAIALPLWLVPSGTGL